MKISVFTVMLPDLTPEEAAVSLSAAGYDGVEWRVTTVPAGRLHEVPSFWGNNLCTLAPSEEGAFKARSLAESAGLEIPNLGTYIQVGDLDAVANAIQFARKAGAPQFRVGVAHSHTGQYQRLFQDTQAFLAEVAQMVKPAGIKALIETHHGTIAASASAAARLLEKFEPDALGVIYDPGNMVFEGFEDYRLGVQILGPYLAHVHLKNGSWKQPPAGGVWKEQWAPLEDGVVDFTALFDALGSAGYAGWLGIEDFSASRSTAEALRCNLQFVKQIIGGELAGEKKNG